MFCYRDWLFSLSIWILSFLSIDFSPPPPPHLLSLSLSLSLFLSLSFFLSFSLSLCLSLSFSCPIFWCFISSPTRPSEQKGVQICVCITHCHIHKHIDRYFTHMHSYILNEEFQGKRRQMSYNLVNLNYKKIKRVIIKVQSFIIKCLSFRRVSFVQE